MSEKNNIIRKDSAAFGEYYFGLKPYEKSVLMDKLAAGCLVPRYTIRNWARGLARIPELHKRKIEEIIGIKIFDSIIE